MKLSEEELCVDVAGEAVKKSVAICLAFVGGVFIVLSLAGVVAYRLRVQLYASWKIHPFDRDECHGEDMDFDVFLCVSSDDDDAHGRSIRNLLKDKGYRVWCPEQDVTPGENVLQSTGHVIEHSKRTVCLLTEQFLNSVQCMYDFDVVLRYNIVTRGKNRLIVLMMLDSSNELFATDTPNTVVLRHYLRQFKYIDYTSADWRNQLFYALPLRPMDQSADRNDVQLLQTI